MQNDTNGHSSPNQNEREHGNDGHHEQQLNDSRRQSQQQQQQQQQQQHRSFPSSSQQDATTPEDSISGIRTPQRYGMYAGLSPELFAYTRGDFRTDNECPYSPTYIPRPFRQSGPEHAGNRIQVPTTIPTSTLPSNSNLQIGSTSTGSGNPPPITSSGRSSGLIYPIFTSSRTTHGSTRNNDSSQAVSNNRTPPPTTNISGFGFRELSTFNFQPLPRLLGISEQEAQVHSSTTSDGNNQHHQEQPAVPPVAINAPTPVIVVTTEEQPSEDNVEPEEFGPTQPTNLRIPPHLRSLYENIPTVPIITSPDENPDTENRISDDCYDVSGSYDRATTVPAHPLAPPTSPLSLSPPTRQTENDGFETVEILMEAVNEYGPQVINREYPANGNKRRNASSDSRNHIINQDVLSPIHNNFFETINSTTSESSQASILSSVYQLHPTPPSLTRQYQVSPTEIPFEEGQGDNFIHTPPTDETLRICKEISDSREHRFDGLLLLGDAWDIIRIDGMVTINKMLHIEKQPKLAYKGVPEALAQDHRYEICLCPIDNGFLYLLITADSPCRFINGRKVQAAYQDMTRRLQDMLREIIIDMQCKSTFEYLIKSDKRIVIYEDDWDRIGLAFAGKLNNLTHDDHATFPEGSKFHFVFKKFGQDRLHEAIDDIESYPHLRIDRAKRAVVHVAIDQEYEGHVLFFNDRFIQRIGGVPSYQYNVGALPRVNNYVYMSIPQNDHNIVALQQYTRLLHSLHKNESGFFNKPIIAKTLLQSYVTRLNGKKLNLRTEDSKLNLIMNGAISGIHGGIVKALEQAPPTKSRTEMIWSINPNAEDQVVRFETVQQLIHGAFWDGFAYIEERLCCDGDLFLFIEQDELVRYLVTLLNHLFTTIEQAQNRISPILRSITDEVWTHVQCAPPLQLFADVAVAEGLIRRVIKGDMGNFPDILETVILDPPENTDQFYDWPFKGEYITKAGGVITSTLNITDLMRHFADILGREESNDYMLDMYDCYRDWMKISPAHAYRVCAQGTSLLFKRVCWATLQKLLAINNVAAVDHDAVMKLWETTCVTDRNTLKCVDSLFLYKFITRLNVSRPLGIIPISNFLELLKIQLLSRYQGGAKLYLAIALDWIIERAKVPLAIRIPEQDVIHMFVPFAFTRATDDIIKIFQLAFQTMYKRFVGRTGIHITRYLRPILLEVANLAVELRPDYHKVFQVLNKLLDDPIIAPTNRVYTSFPFQVRTALQHPDDLPIFHLPNVALRHAADGFLPPFQPRARRGRGRPPQHRQPQGQPPLDPPTSRPSSQSSNVHNRDESPSGACRNNDGDNHEHNMNQGIAEVQPPQDVEAVEEEPPTRRVTRSIARHMVETSGDFVQELIFDGWADGQTLNPGNERQRGTREEEEERPRLNNLDLMGPPQERPPRHPVVDISSSSSTINRSNLVTDDCLNNSPSRELLQQQQLHNDQEQEPNNDLQSQRSSISSGSEMAMSRTSSGKSTSSKAFSSCSSYALTSSSMGPPRILNTLKNADRRIRPCNRTSTTSSITLSSKGSSMNLTSLSEHDDTLKVNERAGNQGKIQDGGKQGQSQQHYEILTPNSQPLFRPSRLSSISSESSADRLPIGNTHSSSVPMAVELMEIDSPPETPPTSQPSGHGMSTSSCYNLDINTRLTTPTNSSSGAHSDQVSEQILDHEPQPGPSRLTETQPRHNVNDFLECIMEDSDDDMAPNIPVTRQPLWSSKSSSSILQADEHIFSLRSNPSQSNNEEEGGADDEAMSVASSTDHSHFSLGKLLKPNRLRLSGTRYDSVRTLGDEEHGQSRSPSPPDVEFNVPKRKAPYSEDETRAIFEFLFRGNYLLYMKAHPICEIMQELQVVHRSEQSIHQHIKTMLENVDLLKSIVSKECWKAIRAAVRDIRSRPKYHKLPVSEVRAKFNLPPK